MEDAALLLVATPATFALGAVLSLALGTRARAANVAGPALALLGCALTALIAARGLSASAPLSAHFSWQIPLGVMLLEVDPLSAWFLAPVAGLGALAAVYGRTYLKAYRERKNLGVAWFAFNLLLGGMATVVLARNGVLFLMAWEIMSLSAWFLVSFEHEKEEARSAGWIYLVATHIGAAALFVLFLLLRRYDSGSADFTTALAEGAPVSVLLLLAIFGFGAKAGLVPLHVWLPEAHAAAPSHVSAVMSGVLVKMGIYGILRMVLVLGPPAAWFPVAMIALGLAGGLLGIAAAIGQRDVKRTLAYSTIENVGIIVLGIGVGTWGWTHGDAAIAGLGLGGALLHVWNHAAMKGLLFLGAGSVLHGAGTKDIERLGGLMRRMPWTGALLTVGAVAITGLPPLNGFVGEWLIYVGLVHGGRAGAAAGSVGLLVVVGLFSLVGALTAACFARLVGIVLLGSPRAPEATDAHESEGGMLLPMAILAGVCVAFGVGAGPLLKLAGRVMAQFVPGAVVPDIGPLSTMGLFVWAALLSGAVGLFVALRGRPAPRAETWGCGYAAPTARMQYTGRSFAELIETHLVPVGLAPSARTPVIEGTLAHPARYSVDYADATLRAVYQPFFRRWAIRFARLRRYQQGKTWLYVGYIGAVVVLALAWSALRTGGGAS